MGMKKASAFIALGLLLAHCVPQVDPATVSEAETQCEPATPDLLVEEAPMLPGRHCDTCHSSSGQASNRVWTAAGTVYGSPTSPCNSGGLEGVRVDLADQTQRILITLYTNRTGNFRTYVGATWWAAGDTRKNCVSNRLGAQPVRELAPSACTQSAGCRTGRRAS